MDRARAANQDGPHEIVDRAHDHQAPDRHPHGIPDLVFEGEPDHRAYPHHDGARRQQRDHRGDRAQRDRVRDSKNRVTDSRCETDEKRGADDTHHYRTHDATDLVEKVRGTVGEEVGDQVAGMHDDILALDIEDAERDDRDEESENIPRHITGELKQSLGNRLAELRQFRSQGGRPLDQALPKALDTGTDPIDVAEPVWQMGPCREPLLDDLHQVNGLGGKGGHQRTCQPREKHEQGDGQYDRSQMRPVRAAKQPRVQTVGHQGHHPSPDHRDNEGLEHLVDRRDQQDRDDDPCDNQSGIGSGIGRGHESSPHGPRRARQERCPGSIRARTADFTTSPILSVR